MYFEHFATRMSVYHVNAWCSQRPVDKSLGFPGIRVSHHYKPLCGCWELNPGPLEEHQCS